MGRGTTRTGAVQGGERTDKARDKDRGWGGDREGGRAGVSWFCVAQGGDSASVPWDR